MLLIERLAQAAKPPTTVFSSTRGSSNGRAGGFGTSNPGLKPCPPSQIFQRRLVRVDLDRIAVRILAINLPAPPAAGQLPPDFSERPLRDGQKQRETRASRCKSVRWLSGGVSLAKDDEDSYRHSRTYLEPGAEQIKTDAATLCKPAFPDRIRIRP